MPSKEKFDFDTEGLDGLDGDEPEAVGADPATAAEVVEGLFAPAPEPESEDEETGESELDAQMLAVDQQLQQAQYYRLMLNDSFFDDDSPIARRVDKEIRTFVRGRLGVLMGVKQAPAQPVAPVRADFTPAQVGALQQLADKVLGMASKPAPAAPPPPAPPALKKVEVKPVAAAPEPVKKAPVVVPPRLKNGKPQGPPPRPAAARPISPGGKQPVVPIDQSRVPEKYRGDPTLQYKNGRLYVQAKNADEQPLWEYDGKTKIRTPLLKDITLPAKPGPHDIQPMPMPDMGRGTAGLSSAFSQAMSIQEDSMVGFADRRAQGLKIGGLLAATVVHNLTGEGES